jgi:hypothetical protein
MLLGAILALLLLSFYGSGDNIFNQLRPPDFDFENRTAELLVGINGYQKWDKGETRAFASQT